MLFYFCYYDVWLLEALKESDHKVGIVTLVLLAIEDWEDYPLTSKNLMSARVNEDLVGINVVDTELLVYKIQPIVKLAIWTVICRWRTVLILTCSLNKSTIKRKSNRPISIRLLWISNSTVLNSICHAEELILITVIINSTSGHQDSISGKAFHCYYGFNLIKPSRITGLVWLLFFNIVLRTLVADFESVDRLCRWRSYPWGCWRRWPPACSVIPMRIHQ